MPLKRILQIASGLVMLLVLCTAGILVAIDFPTHALKASGTRAFSPGGAGYLALQLTVEFAAAAVALYVLTRPSSRSLRRIALAVAVVSIAASLLDLYWLPMLASLQSAGFLFYELRVPQAV